ncbi:MAG: type II toxin-antitoxin system RelE/ParE family toxin [Lachnospiraceae bacterium]|nr:type II toxin-antitoxin system RelE/ParE family toxin [Lachnospiraceae bacterium]
MQYRIRYTPGAQKDMEQVWYGVLEASGSTEIADRYVDDFADKIAEKKKYPETGSPLYYRGLVTGFYSLNFKAYKAFYRIKEPYIEVIRILLAKSDYMKTIFGEED